MIDEQHARSVLSKILMCTTNYSFRDLYVHIGYKIMVALMLKEDRQSCG